jgi:lysophospholipase L1-like esterase
MKKIIALPLIVLLLSFSFLREKPVRVYMIGDSTMSFYKPKHSPVTGWGMPFAYFFDSSVTVINAAQSGRSTRTFREEGFWQPIVNNLRPGDYVLIQFGHNDEASGKQAYTPEDVFKANLIRYVTETRGKGASPVLITPVARRKFDNAGRIRETHEVYSALVRDVAQAYKVPLIDLDIKSQQFLQQLGPEQSKLLFNYLEPGENPHYPEGNIDDTHFNELGARRIAEIVLAEIGTLKLELANRIYRPEPDK